MRKSKIVWLVALALVAGVVAVQAQERPFRDGKQGKRPTPTEMVEKRVERMSRELNLSDEQRTQITAIENESMKRRVEARKEEHADREKIRRVLTPEQQAKWEAMNKERHGKGYGPKGAPCCKDEKPNASCCKAKKPGASCCKGKGPGAPCDKMEKPLNRDRK